MESPAALGSDQLGGSVLLPAWLPLTARLERAFAARVAELPAATRTLLLVAAVDDAGSWPRSWGLRGGGRRGRDGGGAGAGVAAGLVAVGELQLRFRHPLVRSAIHQLANVGEWQATHAALAEVLEGQPDWRAWHLAAASVGPTRGWPPSRRRRQGPSAAARSR